MQELSRRAFLTAVIGAVPVLGVEPRVIAAGGSLDSRKLSFAHTHTKELLAIDYYRGKYVPEALARINYLLRDFRTGDVHAIDTKLLDLLHSLAAVVRTERPFQVISCYRSPATNEMLRQQTQGVASESLHMKGQAIDIRLADVPLAKLHQAALQIKGGGVGYYPSSDFVHVDTGRVRRW